MAKAIGIDIGGTFIDLVVSDESGLRLFKFASTPDAPERGVLEALDTLISQGVFAAAEVSRIAHGSTVATNALLEGAWARTALLTTRGFRDVLEIGRQNRAHLYDLNVDRPDPIVSRDLRFENSERLDSRGQVLRGLDEAELDAVASSLIDANVEAVAVMFLFSYLNPEHERAARDLLESKLGCPITLSSDVLPEFREYERASTTAVCASLRPVIERYMRNLALKSADMGIAPEWQIMQSNGTVISATQAQNEPVRILLSGPAAGVQGAKTIGQLTGCLNLITMDLGGTSCDVALIQEGEIGQTTTGAVGEHPVAVRMNEIHTIGAGGGSIAWIDEGGALRVGPRSAGAVPGPACYGRGGQLPTVSDAHAVLGHLLPDLPLGGSLSLDIQKAKDAIRSIAEPLGLSLERAALGILNVADAAMERAVRVISVERGYDPRQFSLLAFGGAGPLHAVSIARRLSIPQVIVPAAAGVLSAMGLLTCEVGRDYGRSILRSMSDLSPSSLMDGLRDLEARGLSELNAEGIDETTLRREISGDLRYLGQSHELNVRITPGAGFELSAVDIETWVESFHNEHESRFGHASRDEGVELVALRLRITAPPAFSQPRVRLEGQLLTHREMPVWFNGSGPVVSQVIDRRGLESQARIVGPAVLWGIDATLIVPPGVEGMCDDMGTIVLEVA
ncbi:hydantoinase/oxoprolinase family protein [Candidatus Bipolaricaulota bacterium]|jgi:N-methylhydantoinase A|nr:hydantoinase/oxoprolinase family protein [Candidatus Bipolaricaulota bacterium]TFH11711.1 MAG: hydantoinase/oxoprolinase family protein [Candidatus Atribacteria bacterium]